MARVVDPRAAGFDAAQFRDAIRFAMKMGAPANAEDQVTFHWTTKNTFAVADPATNPYDWTAPPATSSSKEDVRLQVVAVEFAAVTEGQSTPMGNFDSSHGVMTILDEDWARVSDADRVLFGDKVYEMLAPTPLGLFDVTVWQVPIVEANER